jgi:hypothetical protein
MVWVFLGALTAGVLTVVVAALMAALGLRATARKARALVKHLPVTVAQLRRGRRPLALLGANLEALRAASTRLEAALSDIATTLAALLATTVRISAVIQATLASAAPSLRGAFRHR